MQTAGRGRQGRAWVSASGNLYASTLVALRAGDPPAATLALVAAVAADEALAAHGIVATIKWPNDLLLGGAKLAGILLERGDERIVVGFGVNVAHSPDVPGRATTSLAAHGIALPPDMLAEALAAAFARWLAIWRGEGLVAVRRRWLERAHPLHTPLSAALPDDTRLNGAFGGLDGDGALILRLADGTSRVIHAGDVFLL